MKSALPLALVSAGLLALAGSALAAPATTVAEAGFAAGPGTDYDISRKLAIGSHVDVIWCGTHDNWCLIEIHNKRGWVPLASLSFKHSRAVNTDGTTTGNGGGPIADAGAGAKSSPAGSQPEAMATPGGGGGGGGPIFTPVGNNPPYVIKH
jgi:uncharacterized protein YraI